MKERERKDERDWHQELTKGRKTGESESDRQNEGEKQRTDMLKGSKHRCDFSEFILWMVKLNKSYC